MTKGTMASRSHPEIKLRSVMGLGILALVTVLITALLLRLLLPVWLAIGSGFGGYWFWQQYRQRRQRHLRHQARLNAKFYQLLQQQHGRMSILDFAIFAQIDGTAAQRYLNRQAQAFSGYCEATPHGDVIYIFNGAAVPGAPAVGRASHPTTSQMQAEFAWAQAQRRQTEQAQVERARAEKAQAAWVNAKQLRALRQLSQPQAAAQSTATSAVRPASSQPTINTATTTPPTVNSPKTDSIPCAPVVRGRACDASDGVVTIEVKAVQG